jgi:hypothetical protein
MIRLDRIWPAQSALFSKDGRRLGAHRREQCVLLAVETGLAKQTGR